MARPIGDRGDRGISSTRHVAHQPDARWNSPNRIALYGRTILCEWLLLALVLFGVWRNGSSFYDVLGERWRSGKIVVRDAGIAAAFLIVSILVTSIIGGHGAAANRSIQFLLPRSGTENAFCLVLSMTAGICEAVYRGYLQKQFMAFTGSIPVGIVLSALIFGGSHLYQGFARAAVIGLMAVLGGILAPWCRSVRPGMIAHFMQDVLGGYLQH